MVERRDIAARCLHVTSPAEALDALKGVEADPNRVEDLLPKMIHLNIIVEGVDPGVADIVRQAMLSLGGDAAVSQGASGRRNAATDLILMGTLKQIRCFAAKSDPQSRGVRVIAEQVGGMLNNLFLDSVPLRTSRRTIHIGERTLIMGILNVTPDSFSDGGRFTAPEMAVDAGIEMVAEGADIIDIGGESTRPGSDPVSQEEELRRVIPVIRGLAKRVDVPLSIDTMKAGVARQAVAEGAEIVNDISSMGHDDGMAKVISEGGAAVVLMHMRGTPKTMQAGDLTYRSLRGEVIAFLRERIEDARAQGIEPERIMVDPGLGFGKTAMDNVRLVKHLGELKVLGRPIVTGASRKSFIGHVTGGTPQERSEGTAAAVTAAIINGSRIIRVHDVAAMKKVAGMADALNKA